MSRSSFVAAFVGLGAVLWRISRSWPRLHVRAVVIAVTIMFGAAVGLQTSTRFAQSYQDRSISNRMEIWKCVPQMIVDAPEGWGLGQAGNAFSNRYQLTENGKRYRTISRQNDRYVF
jgi:O-antigen ligase